MDIIAHTMQYTSNKQIPSKLNLRNYRDTDYPVYKLMYEDCFSDLRRALDLHPIGNCISRQALLEKASDIFILEADSKMIGSVAIYGNEIDDLIVARNFQGKGYGKQLLCFAIAKMQKTGVAPITLHVADWNRGALGLYLKNGFTIVKTETIRRNIH